MVLIAGMPFFMLTEDAKTYLDVYEACDYRPAREHPLVQEWIKGGQRDTLRFQSGTKRVVFVGDQTDSSIS